MHAGPADFALGCETLAVVGGNLGSFLESGNDGGGVGRGIFAPFLDTELGGINADYTAFPGAVFVENLGDTAGHLDGLEEFTALFLGAHSRVTHGAGPHGSHQRADVESFALDQIGDAFQLIVAGFGIGVGQEEKIIDAVVFLPVHLGGGGEVEHAFEADRRFLTFLVALAYETGPHGVV